MKDDKNTLRQNYKSLRKRLSAQDLTTKNQRICQRLFQSLPIHAYSTIHIFLPIIKHNEVNTWLIIDTLRKDFKASKIVVSKSDKLGGMKHYWLKPDTQVVENDWGIPEPVEAQEMPSSEISMVLVPLLIFDKKGQRVGYGKGYYDRFLTTCPARTLKVGLSFFEPIETIGDSNEHDVRLDYCITPERIWHF